MHLKLQTTQATQSFNRYIVECKLYNKVVFIKHYQVLIDTQWNVNNIDSQQHNYVQIVLIDTQWNVNTGQKVYAVGDSSSFNRYIVECKYKNIEVNTDCGLVLIDTQWNVNLLIVRQKQKLHSFNRYIVECKFSNPDYANMYFFAF